MFNRLLLILSVLLCFSAAASQKVILAADKWCPYNCQPKDLHPGFVVEIAQRVFARADIRVKYEIMPWSRAIDMAKQGTINGIIGATKDEVPQFIFPTLSQGISATSFFVRAKDSWRYGGMKSLKGEVLGVIQDYDYGETINRYINARNNQGVDIVTGDNATQINIRKLINGRVTTILEDPVVLAFQVKQLKLQQRFVNAGDLDSLEIYIAFSPTAKKSKEYAQMLQQGMVWLRQTGQLKEILANYGLEDWTQ